MPIFINLDNVLTLERQGELTTVVMVGGEKIYIDTMPETLIGTVLPAGRLVTMPLRRVHFISVPLGLGAPPLKRRGPQYVTPD
jgi:hypothetical protein